MLFYFHVYEEIVTVASSSQQLLLVIKLGWVGFVKAVQVRSDEFECVKICMSV